jgi:hypothetical protein
MVEFSLLQGKDGAPVHAHAHNAGYTSETPLIFSPLCTAFRALKRLADTKKEVEEAEALEQKKREEAEALE